MVQSIEIPFIVIAVKLYAKFIRIQVVNKFSLKIIKIAWFISYVMVVLKNNSLLWEY